MSEISSYLQPLTELTKKRNFGDNGFEMMENALRAFWRVKDQVMEHTTRVLMNAPDPLILYADASLLISCHRGGHTIFIWYTCI